MHANDITVKNLSKRYSKSSDSGGVFDVDATIPRGKFTTLLGESGSGKTTLLRLLAGFLRPDRGEITINGEVVAADDHFLPTQNRDLAMVFQSYALWPHMTVFENVGFGLRARKVAKEEIRTRVGATLELVGLGHLAGRKPASLSGGQQQRVALARSLVLEPGLLLLDEPLSNLDADLRLQMRNQLKTLQLKTRITFVYVTHDQEEAFALSDHMIILDHGRILQQGDSRDLYMRPRNRRVADFMGRGGLHVEGRVGSTKGGECQFLAAEQPTGSPADLGWFPEWDARLQAGAEARLMVHAEDLRLLPQGFSENGMPSLPGRVDTVNFAGREEHVDVVLKGGQTVTVYEKGAHRRSTGDLVEVGFERSQGWVFAPGEPALKPGTTADTGSSSGSGGASRHSATRAELDQSAPVPSANRKG